MQRLLDDGQREDRALMFLMVACIIIFVSRWTGLAQDALADPERPLNIRLAGALFGWLFIVPPAMYILAALTRMLFRLFGGRGGWYSARLALFWALMAASPLWLLNGLLEGYPEIGIVQNIVGAVALAVFLIIWFSSLMQAEFTKEQIR